MWFGHSLRKKDFILTVSSLAKSAERDVILILRALGTVCTPSQSVVWSKSAKRDHPRSLGKVCRKLFAATVHGLCIAVVKGFPSQFLDWAKPVEIDFLLTGRE